MRTPIKHLSLIALAAVGGLLISSCEKQELEQPGAPALEAQSSEYAKLAEAKANYYRKAAKVLAELLKEDDSFVTKVKQGMKLSRPGQENVSFKELMDEGSKVEEIAAGAGKFKSRFKEIEKAQKAKDGTSGSPDAADDLLSVLVQDGAQVYFPYSEVFKGSINKLTVAFDPVSSADVSTGYRFDAATSRMEEVTVDDNYAYSNPTLIVMEDDAVSLPGEPDPYPTDPYPTEPYPSDPTADPSLDSPNLPPSNVVLAQGDTVTEIYIGRLRLKKHLDGLFDGNNEVRFVRSDTFINLDATGRVVAGSNGYVVKNADISRANVRDNNYVTKNILFDSDWIRRKTSQHFAIYEHDPHQTRTLKTTTGVSITVPNQGTVNSSVENTLTYSTDHELRGSQVYYRQSFLNTNTIPTWGGTLKNGFRLYTDDYFEYTLPHRVLYF